MQASMMAPQYQGSDIQAIQAMMGGGDQIQNYQQQLLNAGQNLFSQYQQAPWQLQDLIGQVLSRASGGQGTSTSTMFGPGTTWGQGLLGGAALAGGRQDGGLVWCPLSYRQRRPAGRCRRRR